MFSAGEILKIHYPEQAIVTSKPRWITRNIMVTEIRDLLRVPITAHEFIRRPFTRRGRYLVRARDLERHCWRQFYVGATREFWRPATLQVGLYQFGRLKPLRILDDEFRNTVRDRLLLARMLQDCDDELEPGQYLGVFAHDLRVVGWPDAEH